jgi:GNAT superfamily N-acetyltransferase
VELQQIAVKEAAELQQLMPIIDEVWHEVFTPIIGKEQVAYMLANYQAKANIETELAAGVVYHILMHEGQPAGYFAYEVTPEYLYLSKLYLLKSARGHGYMSEIFNEMETLGRSLGLKLHLRVNRDNALAVSVYEHRGFVKIAEDKADIGHGFFMDDYIFEKELA